MTSDQLKTVAYWQESAERDYQTSAEMMESGHYDWALFIAHLAIEKALKALIVHNGKVPQYTHKLAVLGEQSAVTIPDHFEPWLLEITGFNIEARYAGEKLDFYKRASKDFAEEWHQKCAEIFQWLIHQLG